MLRALLRLRQDRLRLRLRIVASCNLLLGQQFRTRGDVSRLSVIVIAIAIGRRSRVDRHVQSLRLDAGTVLGHSKR